MTQSLDMGRIEALSREVAEAHELVLYDVEFGTSRGQPVLRVTLDRPGAGEPGSGVSVGECAEVSRELGELLDVEEVIDLESYVLEVSSPGIERALRRPEHYDLAVGQNVNLVLSEVVAGQNTWRGLLSSVEGSVLTIRVPPTKNWKKGQRRKLPPVAEWEVVEVPLNVVRRANIVFGDS